MLDQLPSTGWKVLTGSVDFPAVTGRESSREVFITPDLRAALRRVNLRDGDEWLDDARISQASQRDHARSLRGRARLTTAVDR